MKKKNTPIIKQWGLALAFAGLVSIGFGQQTPYLGLYYASPFVLNPASAGLNDYTMATMHYRKNWLGVEGAPETQAVTLDWKVPKQPMGLGLYVSRDVTNFFSRVNAMGSYAYHLKFNEKHDVSFGVSLGVVQNNLNFDNINADLNDPNLYVSNQRSTRFDGTAGFRYLYNKKLEVGFVGQQLLQPAFQYEDEETQHSLTYSLVQHFNITASYRFDLADGEWGLQPLVLVRTPQGLPLQYEGGVVGYYQDKAWMGLTYRHEIGYAVSAGININDRYRLGYLFELPSTELAAQSSGSHEFLLGIRFGGPKAGPSDKELKALKKQNAQLNEKLEILQQEKEELKRRVDGLEALREDYEENKAEIEKMKANQAVNLTPTPASTQPLPSTPTPPIPVPPSPTPTETPTPTPTQPPTPAPTTTPPTQPTPKAASSPTPNAELDERYPDDQYDFEVIVGSFGVLANAKTMQRILKREYNIDAQVSQDNRSKFYHVRAYIETTQLAAFEKGQEIKEKDTKGIINGTPWVNPVKKGE